MRIPWLLARLCILGLLGGGIAPARAMPFAPELEPATLAEDFASAHFVVIGMLYDSKNENGESDGTTEAALLHVIKNHPDLKNKKHLTLNRYVPTKRHGEYYVLFGEVFKGKVDIYRGIQCSGPKDELVRYLKDIEKLAKAGHYEKLDFYQRHFEHRNAEIAEDAYRTFRKVTYAELRHVSKYCDATKLKRWAADEKVPSCRKELYKVLLVFCEEGSGGLDPAIRKDLRRSIDQRHPKADPEMKREILREIERTPKLRCTIEAVTVYSDGIVSRAAFSSDLPFDCRVSFLGRSLSLVCNARLIDGEKNEWGVPPLENHYLFVPLEKSWTVLVPQEKTVSVTLVDKLGSPRMIPLKPPGDRMTKRPSEFSYTITGYSTAYTADLKKRESVYMIGHGKTSVQWKDSPVPPGKKTCVVENQERQNGRRRNDRREMRAVSARYAPPDRATGR